MLVPSNHVDYNETCAIKPSFRGSCRNVCHENNAKNDKLYRAKRSAGLRVCTHLLHLLPDLLVDLKEFCDATVDANALSLV